ncbi:MAG: hypothetical protein NC390_04860 [Fusobacterium sp.]|nr:hypothetical protein [Fusobacterium sp.]
MFGKKTPEPEYRDFRQKTYAELEREVDAAYGEEMKKRNIKIAIAAVILIFLFHDIAGFWVKFGIPHSSRNTAEVIDIVEDPLQTNLYDDEQEIIDYVTLEDKDTVKLRKRAEVSVSGKVVAKNFLFWGNYLPGGKRTFQSAALFDLGLVWGDLAKPEILENYTFYSAKDATSARTLYPTLKLKAKALPLPWEYVGTHMSHLHIVPANASIMSGLIYARKNKNVKLDGYLVDMFVDGVRWMRTTTSREFVNPTARNGGLREIMYVTKLQVGNKIYE